MADENPLPMPPQAPTGGPSMPTRRKWKVPTDQGDYLVESPGELTRQQMEAVVIRGDKLPGVTVQRAQPEPPGTAEMLSELTTGGDKAPSWDKTIGRTAVATLGGLVGGMAGAPFGVTPLTAPLGAALAGAGGEYLRQRGSKRDPNEPKSDRAVGGQAVAAGMGELGGTLLGGLVPKRALTADQQAVRETAKRYDVPMRASEVLGPKAPGAKLASGLERFPERFIFGGGAPQKFNQRQLEALQEAINGLTPESKRDLMAVGIAAQKDIGTSTQAWKDNAGNLFRKIEVAAGDAPVVDLSPVIQRAKELRGENVALPVPGPVSKTAAAKGKGGPSATDTKTGETLDFSSLPPHIQQLLGGSGATESKISFAQARRLEAELGQASRFNQPVGTLAQGQVRALYKATRGAIDAFLKTDAGEAIRPGLQEAKQTWRVGNAIYNEGVNTTLASRNPEQVLGIAFRPGQLTDTLSFKEAVTPATWDAAKVAWMADLYDKAAPQGVLQPGRFATLVKPYLRSGQVEAAFGAKTAGEMEQLATLSSRLRGAQNVAANPSGTGQALLSAGQVFKGAELLAAPAIYASGHPMAGIGTAAAEVFLPPAMGAWTTSRPGIETLIEGLGRKFSRGGIRFGTQLAVQAFEQGE